MLIGLNDATVAKKDLHVGGIGSRASAGFSTVLDPVLDEYEQYEPLLRRVLDAARDVARSADQVVRANPWAAAGAVALVGLAGGYLLARNAR